VMVLDVDTVELEQDLAVADDLLVLVAPVAAFGAEDLLVEAARRGDVPNDDERLRPRLRRHVRSLGRFEWRPPPLLDQEDSV
jgi:hypothetical protein